jgi:large subunit ribosomal protein L18
MRTIKRRRLEGKTDYKARLDLLKSGKPRLVVRKSNRYIIAQLVQSDIAQDKVVAGISSKALLSKGWPNELSGSLKNLSAAYLTGFMLGKLALNAKIKDAILDAGMYRNIKNSRIYSVLKGAVDAGMDIPHNDDVLPPMEMIKNEKMSKIFDKIIKEKQNG